MHFADSLTKDLNEFYSDENIRKDYKIKGRFGLEGNKSTVKLGYYDLGC